MLRFNIPIEFCRGKSCLLNLLHIRLTYSLQHLEFVTVIDDQQRILCLRPKDHGSWFCTNQLWIYWLKVKHVTEREILKKSHFIILLKFEATLVLMATTNGVRLRRSNIADERERERCGASVSCKQASHSSRNKTVWAKITISVIFKILRSLQLRSYWIL